MKKLVTTLMIIFATSLFAGEEKVKVYFDCVLENDIMGCPEIKLGYFENQSLEAVTQASAADITLILRSSSITNFNLYKLTMKSPAGHSLEFPDLALNATFSAGEIKERLLTFLGQATKPYITIANSGEAGIEEEEKPLYVTPYANGSGSKQQGSTVVNGHAELFANYSTPKWRLYSSTYTGLAYSNTNRTNVAPGIETKIRSYGLIAAGIRSIKPQWDVAVFVRHRIVTNDMTIDGDVEPLPEDALRNASQKTAVRLGTEFIAIPFLTSESKGNIAVRYSFGFESHKYVDPETFSYVRELFARHFIDVYLSRHYEKIDLSIKLGVFSSNFRKVPLNGASTTVSVNYKVTPRTTLGVNGTYSYAKNRVLSTAEDTVNFQSLTSVMPKSTFNGTFSVSYTFGSMRLFNKEQRWK